MVRAEIFTWCGPTGRHGRFWVCRIRNSSRSTPSKWLLSTNHRRRGLFPRLPDSLAIDQNCVDNILYLRDHLQWLRCCERFPGSLLVHGCVHQPGATALKRMPSLAYSIEAAQCIEELGPNSGELLKLVASRQRGFACVMRTPLISQRNRRALVARCGFRLGVPSRAPVQCALG